MNLPIWIDYFGRLFGKSNLFVVDRGSTDGSTANPGEVNRLVLPHNVFDEESKTDFIIYFHRSLLCHYDTVIYTDCDELLAPDPALYNDLPDYLRRNDSEYMTAVGLNVLHMITRELPLDPARPILRQRQYARFNSPSCKTLISRVPIRWMPGFHCCDKAPRIDSNLFLFHLKLMDYSIAMRRQQINLQTVWSERSVAEGFGGHHRYDYDRFVRQAFLDPVNILRQNGVSEFEFSSQIAEIGAKLVERNGFYLVPNNIKALVEIPDRLRSVF